MESKIEIICPKCNWIPDGKAHWACNCGCVWNTFKTAGECPECKERWKETMCPMCGKWSLHLDWYHGLDGAVGELVKSSVDNPAIHDNHFTLTHSSITK